MNNKIKIIIIAAIALAVIIVAILFLLKNAAINERLIAQKFFEEEEILIAKAKEKLNSTSQEAKKAEAQLEESIQRDKALNAELEKYDSEIESGENRIVLLDGEVSPLEEKIDLIIPNVAELKKRVENIVKDNLKLSKELTLLEKTTAALKNRLKEYTDKQKARERGPATVLPSIISSTEISGPAAVSTHEPKLRGEVLTVNKEFDFIVVDLGRTKGIEEGMVLSVMRDDKILAQVTVETVRENISAAALIDKENILQIRAGDKVYLQ